MDSRQEFDKSSLIERVARRFHLWPRRLGSFLEAAGVSGLVLSLLGLVLVPILVPGALHKLHATIETSVGQIQSFDQAIGVASESLDSAGASLEDLADLFDQSDRVLEDTIALLHSAGSAIGEDASATVQATRQAVIAAQEGARAIDSTLRALSVIEFLTGITYNPEKSLSASLEDVATSLEDLPGTLVEIENSMNSTAGSLGEMRLRLADTSEDLHALADDVYGLADEVVSLRGEIGGISEDIAGFNQRLGRWEGFGIGMIMMGFLALGVIYLAVAIVGSDLKNRAQE